MAGLGLAGPCGHGHAFTCTALRAWAWCRVGRGSQLQLPALPLARLDSSSVTAMVIMKTTPCMQSSTCKYQVQS